MTVFDVLAAASEAAAATSSRSGKVEAIAAALRALAPHEVAFAVAALTGTTLHGRIGVGWSTLAGARPAPDRTELDRAELDRAELDRAELDRAELDRAELDRAVSGGRSVAADVLSISDVAAAIDRLAAMHGDGVVAARRAELESLFSRANDRERRLLTGIFGGELRQGALDGVVTTAVAKAAGVSVGAVRRAAMMAGELPVVATAAMTSGEAGLAAIQLEPLRPVQPMLASPGADVAAAVAEAGGERVAVEWKLDGARIQVHRDGDEVAVFTRNLNDVTARLPHVVEVARRLPVQRVVLDGEVLGLGPDGTPLAFQDTMADVGTESRVGGAKQGVAGGAGSAARVAPRTELRPYLFDVLHIDGASVHDEPLLRRREMLRELVPPEALIASILTADVDEAQRFLAAAVDAGHEGVVVKDLDQPYAAGRRGAAWRKVKPVHTFDLVVLAAEWGHGRRTGWLSNLHLGARDPDDGSFVMVGKTFKGLTDELLRWQTERFLGLELGRERNVVHLRPEQVVEVAIDGVQRSTRYPGGVALRFARVRQYRPDKMAAEADSIDRLRGLLR